MISKKDRDGVYSRALALWGKASQMLQTMEECAELIQALSHKMRRRDHNVEEEIADVEIMITQMRLISDMNKIDMWKERKLERLHYMIKDQEDLRKARP